jgi:isopenicillin N synthase-like dioxygenase
MGDVKECFHFANSDWQAQNGEAQKLPASLEEHRDTVDTFISEINRVARTVLQAISLSLNVGSSSVRR